MEDILQYQSNEMELASGRRCSSSSECPLRFGFTLNMCNLQNVWLTERCFLKKYDLNMTVFNFPEQHLSSVSVPVNYQRPGVVQVRSNGGGGYLSEILFFDVMHVMWS